MMLNDMPIPQSILSTLIPFGSDKLKVDVEHLIQEINDIE